MAQKEREKGNVLSKETLSVAEGGEFHVGDRVLLTKKSRLYGVENGSLVKVVAVAPETNTLSARLDDGSRVTVPLEAYSHVRLGYAMTTHKGQGATVEKAFVLAGGSMQDREITYVQASRSRGETRIFTDKETAGEQLTQLVQQMKQSRQKEMAHTVVLRAEPSQGIGF